MAGVWSLFLAGGAELPKGMNCSENMTHMVGECSAFATFYIFNKNAVLCSITLLQFYLIICMHVDVKN